MKEVRQRILLLNSNPYSFLHECVDFADYISRCKGNIIHSKLKYRDKSVEYYTNILTLANKLKEIAIKENLIISKSPYSTSFYAHSKSDNISWEHKPNNSYRLSNHWNWTDYNKEVVHCPTITNEDYGLCICQYINGYYNKV